MAKKRTRAQRQRRLIAQKFGYVCKNGTRFRRTPSGGLKLAGRCKKR